MNEVSEDAKENWKIFINEDIV